MIPMRSSRRSSFALPWLAIALPLLGVSCREPPHGGTSDGAAAHRLMARHGCTGCHVIPGVPGAAASVGPPLTAIGRRVYVGGRLNTPRNLADFIQNPSAVRPSTMPVVGIAPEDAERVAAYLTQLR